MLLTFRMQRMTWWWVLCLVVLDAVVAVSVVDLQSPVIDREDILSTGGFYVANAGISRFFRDSLFSDARQFFALPEQIKRRFQRSAEESSAKPGLTRGFIGYGEESGSRRFESKEAFSYGYEWGIQEEFPKEPNELEGTNIWPEISCGADENMSICSANWRFRMVTLYQEMVRIAEEIVEKILAPLLDMDNAEDKRKLLELCRDGDKISIMRLFRYVAFKDKVDSIEKDEVIGSSPHTDWGFLTLIIQDSPGLEIFDEKTESWESVAPSPDSHNSNETVLFVNVGDYLSLATGGKLKSPLHRVLPPEPASPDRLSFVFFYYPRFDANLADLLSASNIDESSPPERHSLLQDQTVDSQVSGPTRPPLSGSIGSFLAHKWSEVQRKRHLKDEL